MQLSLLCHFCYSDPFVLCIQMCWNAVVFHWALSFAITLHSGYRTSESLLLLMCNWGENMQFSIGITNWFKQHACLFCDANNSLSWKLVTADLLFIVIEFLFYDNLNILCHSISIWILLVCLLVKCLIIYKVIPWKFLCNILMLF